MLLVTLCVWSLVSHLPVLVNGGTSRCVLILGTDKDEGHMVALQQLECMQYSLALVVTEEVQRASQCEQVVGARCELCAVVPWMYLHSIVSASQYTDSVVGLGSQVREPPAEAKQHVVRCVLGCCSPLCVCDTCSTVA